MKIKYFYLILKAIFLFADFFLLSILSVLLVTTFKTDEFILVIILSVVFLVLFSVFELLLLKYYGNVVISMNVVGDDVIIITNKRRYTFLIQDIYMVKEDVSLARTYIFVDDKNRKQKFVYIMRYAFKTRSLDIANMKGLLPYTIFE